MNFLWCINWLFFFMVVIFIGILLVYFGLIVSDEYMFVSSFFICSLVIFNLLMLGGLLKGVGGFFLIGG